MEKVENENKVVNVGKTQQSKEKINKGKDESKMEKSDNFSKKNNNIENDSKKVNMENKLNNGKKVKHQNVIKKENVINEDDGEIVKRKNMSNSHQTKNAIEVKEKRDTSQDTKVFNFKKSDLESTQKVASIEAIKKENKSEEKNSNNVAKSTEKSTQIKNAQNLKETVKSNSEQNQKDVSKYNNYKQKSQDVKYNNYEKNNKNKSKKNGLIIMLVIMIIILILIVFSTVFGLINMSSNKIIKGISVNNIEISDLTKEEAINKLELELNNNENSYITITRNGYTKDVNLATINGKFNIEDAVNMAYNYGRSGNIVENNYKTLEILVSKNNILANFSYDDELLQKLINDVSLDMPDLALNSSYVIEGNQLIIKNSTSGIRIKKDEFIKNTVNAFSNNTKSFEIPVEECPKEEIDIEKIHNEIYKGPVNAYYTTNPRKIYKEEDGLDFAISVSEAKKLLMEDKSEYIIKLKKIKPQVTVANLDSGAYPDKLSTFTTKYGTGDVNRNTNIALAAKSISNVVLMPGETFSYNDLIGECSTKTGYKAATIYLNGQLSTGIGGGICQVSTTLYNTVLRANLEIVQRRNHSLGVTYVPSGQDAMVSIGTQDFKFKNNRDYPIKVVAYVGTGSVTCEIYGLKQENEYEVKLYSRTISKTDKNYKVETYKILYLNGQEVSRTWLSTDTYKYH